MPQKCYLGIYKQAEEAGSAEKSLQVREPCDCNGLESGVTEPNISLGTLLQFPDRRNACPDQQPERRTSRLVRSNNQLVHALERLSDSYRALLVGERIGDAEEILAEASNALMTAAKAGDVETA
jgi:hypothetical protein